MNTNTEEYTIISAELTVAGELEIVKRYPSNSAYLCYPSRPVPDKIIKEIYAADAGRIVLIETIAGKHTPSHVIPDKIEF